MKKIIKNVAVLVTLVSISFSNMSVFAQSADYGTYNPSTDYGTYSPTTDYGTYSPTSDYGTYNPSTDYGAYTPTTDYGTYNPTVNYGTTDYSTYTPTTNYGTYSPTTDYGTYSPVVDSGTYSPSTDYGTYSPTSDYGTYNPSTDYGIYTPTTDYGTYTPTVDYGTYSPTTDYGTYTPTVDYGTYTPTVDYGTYNPTTSWYAPSTNYTPVTSIDYYTAPSTSWYTSPTWNTTTIIGGGVTCNNYSGYYLSGNTCIKQCTNGATVVYPNNCSIPVPPTPINECNTSAGYYFSNGQCVKQCSNGATVVYPNQCPIVQPPTTCNDGYYFQNGICIRNCPNGGTVTQPNQCPTVTPPVTCDNNNGYYYNGSVCIKFCQPINGYVTYPNICPNPVPPPTPVPTCDTANGYYYSNGSCIKNCGNTIVTQPNSCPFIPPVVTCDNANGYYYNLSSCVKFCQSINGYVTYPQNCPAPIPTPYPVPVPVPTQTQVCFDGSVISAYATCPNPYQVCPDGSLVSRNGYCPINQIIAPVPVINNVITSIPTQIANTSARCNGIGLIPNNTPSVAWFEYGTSPTLGAKTVVANIGSANTSPFTNLLTNLRPSTEYFCRAVMANSLGVVRGDIVHFTTKSKATYYPVITKTVKTKKITKVVTPVKKEVICSDGSTVEATGAVDGKDGVSMLEMGQKALSLSLTKTKGDITPNTTAVYFVSFKNDSTSNLTDASIVISLPEEMTLVNATVGSYDIRSRELTIVYPVMTPAQAGSLEIEVGIAKEAIIGKSIAVQAHASYTIPPKTAKGKALTDEVTAYAVSTITSAPLSAVPAPSKEEVKKISTSTNSFLPNTIVEWVALFAILLIIIVLVRSIRESYNQKETHH